jgi:hypothetical protein
MERKAKEPILAAILSLLLGLGAIYNGQTLKGIVFIVVRLGLGLLACFLFYVPTGLPEMGLAWVGIVCCSLPLLASALLALFDAIDAYMLAQRINEGEVLRDWEFFFTR